jgi:hypothetical protein
MCPVLKKTSFVSGEYPSHEDFSHHCRLTQIDGPQVTNLGRK